MFNVQYLLQGQSNKKEANTLSNFYDIGTLLHFLNFYDFFHMANRDITSGIVSSTEQGKFGI